MLEEDAKPKDVEGTGVCVLDPKVPVEAEAPKAVDDAKSVVLGAVILEDVPKGL
jgi:ribosome biogenesis SPOUT family RNA methylase Rps3